MKERTVTFFSRNKRTKKIKISDQNRRKVILTMLRENVALSTYEIAAKSEVPKSDVYEIAKEFVRGNLAQKREVAKYANRQDSNYALTENGKIIALGISYDEPSNPVGISAKSILQELFQPPVGADAMTLLGSYAMLNCIERGLTSYVLGAIRKIAEKIERSDFTLDWRRDALIFSDYPKGEEKRVKESVLSALSFMTELDQMFVYQFFKNKILEMMTALCSYTRDRSLQDLILKSQMDPTRIYIPVNCKKCKYHSAEISENVQNFAIKMLTKGSICPRCNKGFVFEKWEDLQAIMA